MRKNYENYNRIFVVVVVVVVVKSLSDSILCDIKYASVGVVTTRTLWGHIEFVKSMSGIYVI